MYSVIVVDGDTETVELLKTRGGGGTAWGAGWTGTALSIKEGLFLCRQKNRILSLLT